MTVTLRRGNLTSWCNKYV